MSTATKAVQAARFLAGCIGNERGCSITRVRGDLFSRLVLPNHHTDPYQIYEEMRAQGPMLPTRLGNYSTTSHRLCNEVLRSRRSALDPKTAARTLQTRQDSTCHCSNSTHPTTPDPPARRAGLHTTADGRVRGIGRSSDPRLLDQ